MIDAETFRRFDAMAPPDEGVYTIGRTWRNETGVVQEIADCFDFKLADTPDSQSLALLSSRVAPFDSATENIENINLNLRKKHEDSIEKAAEWINRSGLLEDTHRRFLTPGASSDYINLAIIVGGSRSEMDDRAARLQFISEFTDVDVDEALLVARESGNVHGAIGEELIDVDDTSTEAGYMGVHIAEKIQISGLFTELIIYNESDNRNDMRVAVDAINDSSYYDLEEDRFAVISEPGRWPELGGEFRIAARRKYPDFDYDGRQLVVSSDSAEELSYDVHKIIKYNPFMGVIQIIRNAHMLSSQIIDI